MKDLKTKLSNEKQIIAEAEKIINKENLTKTPSKTSPKNHDNEKPDKKSLPVKKAKNKKAPLLILIFVVIVIISILSFIFGFIASKSDKIISGISVNGVDISNLNKEEAIEKLNLQLSENLSNEIQLTRGDYSTTLNVSTIEPSFSFENAIDTAYSIGRSENNIFANNIKVISTHFNKQNIIPSVNYNQAALNNIIITINNELPDKGINSSYKIENNNLIISNSSSGYRIQNDALSNYINLAILNNINTIEIPVEQYEAESIDIEAIYNEIYTEAKNASFTTNPYQIHKEEDGLDFAISLNEAKKIITQEQESYSIPLKTIKPKITVKNLGNEAFPDSLATYSTTYSTGNKNRSTNIALSAKAVNGYVLMPGETFSYNDTVGQRTAARGYKEAGVYVNGEVSTGIGGGICQVSSTLYNAVLLANLEVVNRTNHTFEPSYVPAGQDATVSWGAPDFKFKNNRNYPIKLVATTGSGRVTFNIYGLKTNDDYQVKILSYKVGTVPFSTQYQEDSSLPSGTKKVIQSGSNGCKTQTYKVLYKNGVEVSKTLISSDTYKPHNQVVKVGTGAVKEPVQTPVETPSTGTEPTEKPSTNNSTGTTSVETPSFEITY